MQRVTGIGGIFFRANDPSTMGQWYKDHLGIDLVAADYQDSLRPALSTSDIRGVIKTNSHVPECMY